MDTRKELLFQFVFWTSGNLPVHQYNKANSSLYTSPLHNCYTQTQASRSHHPWNLETNHRHLHFQHCISTVIPCISMVGSSIGIYELLPCNFIVNFFWWLSIRFGLRLLFYFNGLQVMLCKKNVVNGLGSCKMCIVCSFGPILMLYTFVLRKLDSRSHKHTLKQQFLSCLALWTRLL